MGDALREVVLRRTIRLISDPSAEVTSPLEGVPGHKQGGGPYMRGKLILGAALAVSLSAGVLTAGQAWAKGPNGKTVCSTITGSTGSGTITISGCVDANTASTGGASKPLSIAALAAGGTVTWVNNKTTTFSAATLSSGNAKKCPGYVKPVKGQPAPKEPSETKFTGTVTSDTSGMKVPGKYKGDVCIDQSGNITARKPLKVN
jgi:hypothetical protein